VSLALLVAEAQTLTNSMENAIFWDVAQPEQVAAD
jgi:hypothetical protein